MRRTIIWPPVIDGGQVMMTPDPDLESSDEDQALEQSLGLGLLPGNSSNPWNTQEGVGVPDQTFSAINGASRRVRRGEVEERFASLERERRARLVSINERTSADGAVFVEIEYENLETGERSRLEAR